MKKYLLAVCATLALASSVSARDVNSMTDWVLLTLGWANGEGAETLSAGLVPEFSNQGACQAALRRALQKDALRVAGAGRPRDIPGCRSLQRDRRALASS